ncbi:MAG: hypothetical protein WC566_05770 [Dehalococcoidia bacterium]
MRSEEDKLTQAPLLIILGGKEYEVKPLVIRDSRAWNAKFAKLIGGLPQYTKVTTDSPDQFKVAIEGMVSAVPDAIIDLVFEYARDLNREEIEAVATDAEILVAFTQIMEVAFPLARSLAGAMKELSARPSSSSPQNGT